MRTIAVAILLLAGCGQSASPTRSQVSTVKTSDKATKSEKLQQAEPPAFDPKSAEKTLGWIVYLNDRFYEAFESGNEFVTKEADAKRQAALKSMAGKKVEWLLKVESITKEGVTLQAGSSTYQSKRVDAILTGIHFTVDDKSRDSPFPNADPDWMKKAKRGDRALLQGTIVLVSIEVSGGGLNGLRIQFGEHKVASAE